MGRGGAMVRWDRKAREHAALIVSSRFFVWSGSKGRSDRVSDEDFVDVEVFSAARFCRICPYADILIRQLLETDERAAMIVGRCDVGDNVRIALECSNYFAAGAKSIWPQH
jgi:hypothetical protein